MKRSALLLAAALCAPAFAARAADCIDQAASAYQVNADVLRAIAIVESRVRPDAVRVNPGGSVDRGLFQINSVHLPELARVGIDAGDLHDVCIASHVASLLLARQIRRFGDTWTAIGAFHSTRPDKRDAYAGKVREVFEAISRLSSGVR